MKDYVLMMDVAGDVDKEIADKNNLHLIPMEFIIDGTPSLYTYTDFDLVKFYDEIKKKINIKTSQITPALYEEYFEPFLKQGKSVLYLALSTGLSSTYQSALNASSSLKAKYPDLDVMVIDSLAATTGMGIIAERMIENKNKAMDIKQNFDDIQKFKSRVNTMGVIGDLVMLKRGGRISAATAFFGGLLNIKPIIQIVREDGTLRLLDKRKGMKAGLNYLLNYYAENRDPSSNVLYLVHSNEENYASELEQMLRDQFKDIQIRKKMLSPIIGAHLGPASVVISFILK